MGAEGTGTRGGREGALGDGIDLGEGPDPGDLAESGGGEGGSGRGLGVPYPEFCWGWCSVGSAFNPLPTGAAGRRIAG